MFNGTALNGATLNGSGGTRVQMAFAAVDVVAAMLAAAWAKRQGDVAPVQGNAEVSWSDYGVTQRHVSGASIAAAAGMVAAVPKIRHASAAMVLSTGEAFVSPFAFRAAAAAVDASAHIADGYVYADRSGSADVACTALASGTAFGFMYPHAAPSAEAHVTANAVRRCPSAAAPITRASVNVVGGYSIAAQSAMSCRAVVNATAGYGVPSLSVLTCRAGAYVYARQIIKSGSAFTGKAITSAEAIGGFGGEAHAVCAAMLSATAIAEQGQCDDLTARAVITASAEYWHQTGANISAASILSVQALLDHCGQAGIFGTARTRVETQVNNELEGYSEPTAVSVLGINVNGVAVAMTIGHIHAFADVQPVAEYWHMAKGSSIARSLAQSSGTLMHMAEASIHGAASMDAIGHWEWSGAASVFADCAAGGFANMLHRIENVNIPANADVFSYATYGHSAFAQALATCAISDGYIFIDMPGASAVDCSATCTAESIGNPDARDPLARTMNRPRVERTMTRPFVDRTMKTTSA